MGCLPGVHRLMLLQDEAGQGLSTVTTKGPNRSRHDPLGAEGLWSTSAP